MMSEKIRKGPNVSLLIILVAAAVSGLAVTDIRFILHFFIKCIN